MNLSKDLGWRCRSIRPMNHVDLLGLIHLYQPIIGARGMSLYLTLQYQLPLHRSDKSALYQHSFLLRFCACSFAQMVEARYMLEGVGLLNCYEKTDTLLGHYYEYELIPPLTPTRFFQSDVLSVSLFNVMGSDAFIALKNQFTECEEPLADNLQVTNVTKSFQEVFGSLSPIQLEQAASQVRGFGLSEDQPAEELKEGKYPEHKTDHDFSFIQFRLSSFVNDEVWTPALIAQLREICFLYQLDEWDILKVLQNPYVTSRGMIDLERLRSFVKNEYRLRFGGVPVITSRQQMMKSDETPESKITTTFTEEEKHIEQLSMISPLELLSHYQKGAKVPDSDLELVDSLVCQYQLPSGVINVLLEYVLLKYDYRLPRNLVEKIAGHWKRLGVQTAEAAIEQARKEDWDLKKKRTSATSRKVPAKDTVPLPKAVAKQIEMKNNKSNKEKSTPKYTEEDLARKKALIQEKLRTMNEKRTIENQ